LNQNKKYPPSQLSYQALLSNKPGSPSPAIAYTPPPPKKKKKKVKNFTVKSANSKGKTIKQLKKRANRPAT
jgi:hypothetical protein